MGRKKVFKYIYGPVFSWRLGKSLGIDAVYTGKNKICSFNCIYCQAGKTTFLTDKRRVFVKTKDILCEVRSLPKIRFDYITFSGSGEPTLARNLGDIIRELRKIRKEKIAILTNSSIIYKEDVQRDLCLADFVIAKLDVHGGCLLDSINRPVESIRFDKILGGLVAFRRHFKNKFAIQIMFVGKNLDYAEEMEKLMRKIKPDEIQICTPVRPCAEKALSKNSIYRIKKIFEAIKGVKTVSVYDVKSKYIKPISTKAVLRRRREI